MSSCYFQFYYFYYFYSDYVAEYVRGMISCHSVNSSDKYVFIF